MNTELYISKILRPKQIDREIDSNTVISDDFDTLLYQGRLFEQNLINLFRRNEVTKTSAYVNEIDT